MGKQLGSCSTLNQRGRTKKKTEDSPVIELFIPDELITGILGWLPAKDVVRFRCVCRKWRDLTSTREFTNLHIRCSVPMFLKGQNRVTLVDRCWEPTPTRSNIYKVYQPSGTCIKFSHNGLVIDQGNDGKIIIYNPIYRDMVSIIPNRMPLFGEPFGIFFHPLWKEYCTLWRVTISPLEPWIVQYGILNLESNPIWRDIRNPCTQNNRISQISPVLIDMYLYWMVEPDRFFKQTYNYKETTFCCDIMRFDIRNGEFRTMPCPVPITLSRQTYNVNLIDIDGRVSLVQVVPRTELTGINIWTLNDGWEHLWTCSTYIISSDVYPENGVPIPIAFWNGELVIQSNGRLYVCNLKLGTYRNTGSQNHYRPHLVSLVSLKNWKSKTCKVEEDENNHKDKGYGGETQTPNQV